MSDKAMFEVFGDKVKAQYQEEVEQRWGETESYKESRRRTQRYRKADWEAIKAESESINAEIAALMDANVAPDDARAMQSAERHRAHIDHWFYPCSHAMHVALGQLYVSDPRFAASYEQWHAGLARYLSQAIEANANRAGD